MFDFAFWLDLKDKNSFAFSDEILIMKKIHFILLRIFFLFSPFLYHNFVIVLYLLALYLKKIFITC